uniref:Uncharacterized protein n=1 Tax=uncultured marine virus TaxID=186617 RepID=A0A0F7L2A0_9VIRU|nr:hypothetical protein [uncultured marine virus]
MPSTRSVRNNRAPPISSTRGSLPSTAGSMAVTMSAPGESSTWGGFLVRFWSSTSSGSDGLEASLSGLAGSAAAGSAWPGFSNVASVSDCVCGSCFCSAVESTNSESD